MRPSGCLRDLRPVELSLDRIVSSFETELRGEQAEDVQITDVQCLFPVGQHESIVRLGVPPLYACKLGETEGRARVRHDLGRWVVDEALALEPAPEVLVEGLAVAA